MSVYVEGEKEWGNNIKLRINKLKRPNTGKQTEENCIMQVFQVISLVVLKISMQKSQLLLGLKQLLAAIENT